MRMPTKSPDNAWRNMGYDDGLAGHDKRTDVPEKHRAAYLACYRRGAERLAELKGART